MTTVYETEEFKIPQKFQDVKEPPSDKRFIASLLIPGLIVFTTAILAPIAIGIFISFTNSSASAGYFGSKISFLNYTGLLFDNNVFSRNFYRYTMQTIFFSVVSVVIEFLLGLVFAHILNKNFKGRGIARATLLIPWAIPTIASATIFRFEIFTPIDEFGAVNGFLQLFNLPTMSFFGSDAPVLFYLPYFTPFEPFLNDLPITLTMVVAIVIDVWKTTPFITLLILAALQIVSKDLYNAGEIAGASGWQKFQYITWPLIKPGVGIALIFRLMQALRVYDAIVVFKDETVRSMTVQAVDLWLGGSYGLASAITVILLFLIIIFAFIIVLFTRREKRYGAKEESLGDKILKKMHIIKSEKKRQKKIETSVYLVKDSGDLASKAEELEEIIKRTKMEPISLTRVKWYKYKRYLRMIGFSLLVIFMCLFCAGPFIWILIRSFRNPFFNIFPQDSFELFPRYLSLEAYRVLFESTGVYGVTFGRALLNGLVLSGLTVIVVIVVGALIAYALAKFEFPFKRALNGFIFSMNSLPPLIIIVPFFIQVSLFQQLIPFLKLQDNLFGLVLPYAAFNLPLAVFVLRAFFQEIPEDLWKAAKVDGATNFQIFRKVILPLTIPGIFTCAILVFIASWNELLFAQIFLVSPENYNVPRAILRYVRNPQSIIADWDTEIVLMAATSLATIPLVIVVLIFQKKIVSGLTRGAVKG